MPTPHQIAPGDGISSLASQHGFAPETLWEHPANADLKRKRADPNVLLPGDVLVVPDKTPRTEPCATDRRHVFRRIGVPARFEMQLLTPDGPVSGVAYELRVEDKALRGQTDSSGLLRQFVPNQARRARLSYEHDGRHYELDIGFGLLDPIDTLRGVQQRLRNLGYSCDVPGVDGPRTRLAVQLFQLAAQLEPSGERDVPTLTALTRLHDSAECFPPPASTR
jgi:hypothetical protein